MRLVTTSLIAATIALSACSKPTDTVIPTDAKDWDTKLAPVMKKLGEEDRNLFAAYMLRHMMGSALSQITGDKNASGIAPGTTVGQAIDEQKKWVKEQERKDAEQELKDAEAAALKKEAEEKAAALKKEAEEKAAALIEQMNKSVQATVVSKKFLAKDYQAGRYSDQIELKIAIKNVSQKDIEAIAGRMFFIDIFGKEVADTGFKVTESIKAGDTFTWDGVIQYNEFVKSHQAIRELQEGKYTTRFEPKSIVFADGTKLSTD